MAEKTDFNTDEIEINKQVPLEFILKEMQAHMECNQISGCDYKIGEVCDGSLHLVFQPNRSFHHTMDFDGFHMVHPKEDSQGD